MVPLTSRVRLRLSETKRGRRRRTARLRLWSAQPAGLRHHGSVRRNYGGRDTRGWFRMIIPLWKPSSDAADRYQVGDLKLRPRDDHSGESNLFHFTRKYLRPHA